MKTLARALLSIACLFALTACGSSDRACTPGAQVSCACPGGGSGIQRCTDRGTYDECVCDAPTMADAAVADAAMLPEEPMLPDAATPEEPTLPDAATPEEPARCGADVDLLLMIDDSASMAEEQAALVEQLPMLVRALASGDLDGDGAPDLDDFVPVRSLQVGVITSNMGTGGYSFPTCGGGTFGFDFGDDGVLSTRGHGADCMESGYPSVLAFQPADPEAEAAGFVSDLACVTTTGTRGCGWEQQLEAVLKALSPSMPTEWTAPGYEPPVFFRDTHGHALDANAGFVRPGSVLAAVLLTDEDDCAVADPRIFDADSPLYPSDLNIRCSAHPAALHPTSRFVDGLAGLRQDPERLVFTVIAGVPEDFRGHDAEAYEEVLADERMQEVVENDPVPRLRASCTAPGRGSAYPPRRIVQVARGLDERGAHTSVHSVCAETYSPAIESLVRAIASAPSTCD